MAGGGNKIVSVRKADLFRTGNLCRIQKKRDAVLRAKGGYFFTGRSVPNTLEAPVATTSFVSGRIRFR